MVVNIYKVYWYLSLKIHDQILFDLTMPLHHIDFHIIDYWMSNWMPFWHIFLEETHCHHIDYSSRDILYALSHRQNSTYHSLWWSSCELLVGTENSPKCKWVHCAGSIKWSKPSQVDTLLPELVPATCDQIWARFFVFVVENILLSSDYARWQY